MAAPVPESPACVYSMPRRQAGRLLCVLASPARPPPGLTRRRWFLAISCPCGRGCAGRRGMGKPQGIAVDDATGTTETAGRSRQTMVETQFLNENSAFIGCGRSSSGASRIHRTTAPGGWTPRPLALRPFGRGKSRWSLPLCGAPLGQPFDLDQGNSVMRMIPIARGQSLFPSGERCAANRSSPRATPRRL